MKAAIGAWIALCCALLTSEAAAAPPVWTVRGSHGVVILFGSIHALPPGLNWRTPELDDALSRADELWFETPLDPASQAQAAGLLRARGALPANDSLTKHLSSAEVERLKAACDRLGVPVETVSAMRPWLADVTLSLWQAVRAGASVDNGVEIIINQTAAPKASRHAFESDAQQVSMLAESPPEDQAASLNATLKALIEDPDAYRRVVDEWMAGDVAALERDALADMALDTPGDYRRLITDRNARWTRTLVRRLHGGGTVVVVVGVGHLIGPEGVPALLKARGFRVAGPE